MDVLSDVLLAVRLTGAVFFDVDARTPFATESPGADKIAEQVMGAADRVIGFHDPHGSTDPSRPTRSGASSSGTATP